VDFRRELILPELTPRNAPARGRGLQRLVDRHDRRDRVEVTRAEAARRRAGIGVNARVAGQNPSEKATDAVDTRLARAKRDAIAANIAGRPWDSTLASVNAERSDGRRPTSGAPRPT